MFIVSYLFWTDHVIFLWCLVTATHDRLTEYKEYKHGGAAVMLIERLSSEAWTFNVRGLMLKFSDDD